MSQQIVCGIDIGNTSIKTAIGGISRELLKPQIIGVASVPSTGMRHGVVVDMEETVSNIRQSVGEAEAQAGIKVNRAFVSINGLHVKTHISHGVIAVSRADGEISPYDIERVIDAASAVSLPLNREIIHQIPRNFIIDGAEHVKNALGMKGVRLEADVLLIEGLSPHIRNLAKCVNANGIEVAEFVFGPLATAKSVLDKSQLEHGVLSVDFGGGVSSLALFYEGELVHTATLPIGSRHITNDIAIALRTPMDNAERVKREYGSISPDDIASKELLDLSEILNEDELLIPKKHIVKIIDARVSELFDLISDEMKKVSNSYLLPAGVVLVGGGSNLSGLPALTKDRLKLSVRIGNGNSDFFMGGLRNKPIDPSFATALGLVIWGFEKDFSVKNSRFANPFSRSIIKKVGRWLRNFLP